MMRFPCPNCDFPLAAPAEFAGRTTTCRQCKKPLTIPAPTAPKPAAPPATDIVKGLPLEKLAPAKESSQRGKAAKAAASSKTKPFMLRKEVIIPAVIAVGAGGVLLFVLLIGGGITAWLWWRKPEPALAKTELKNKAADPKVGAALEPKKPLKVVDPNAGKPLPDTISAEARERVKKATAYLRVRRNDGQLGSGTGFLAIEKGLVVTNAHVVGMLDANSQPPRSIDVVLYSGQPGELRLAGHLLGVDRTSDLAFLRIEHPNLPEMIPLDADRPLFETQKVYIFGFPLGEALGTEITVSTSEVSSFRNDKKTGELAKIQVNGGMQPGNSGGPVVNTHGSVVGICVSIIKGTQLNFAIPVVKVGRAMEGRISEAFLGQAVLVNNQTLVPIRCTCLDPLGKIKRMRVEVWAGQPGPPRPYSLFEPPPFPGDEPKHIHDMIYNGGQGQLDVPLPPIKPGQVYWLQPIIHTADGPQWGEGLATPLELYPIERKPATLSTKLAAVKERTVKLKSAQGLSAVVQNQSLNVYAHHLEADLLEVVSSEPPNLFRIQTAYGNTRLAFQSGDKVQGQRPLVVNLLRELAPVFWVDKDNRYQKRWDRDIHPQMEKRLREDTQAAYAQLCNSFEAVSLNVPNRLMQPKDRWQTKLPLILRGKSKEAGPKSAPVIDDLMLVCTFEGVRRRAGRDEGLIAVAGQVVNRGGQPNNVGGLVIGKLAVDLQDGFISFADLKIDVASTILLNNGNSVAATLYFDIELTRQPGNPLNIAMLPVEKGPAGKPPIIARGKVMLDQQGMLDASDPVLPNAANFKGQDPRMKAHALQMEAGKTYVITLSSAVFDSYLLVQDGAGKVLAEDDDSGGGEKGLDARIEFRCPQSGAYRIVATAFDGQLGAFHLRVQEAE